MATSYYSTGIISLTNGSAVVTGVGTAWQTVKITNGYLLVEAAEGNVLPILTVDSNTQITAEFEWQGATGTYSYALMRNPDQLQDNAENSKNLVALLNEIRNGLAFKYDASGLLADRALFDARPKGFAYLVIGGATADLYVKRSNTAADWAGPYAYGTGPIGPMGPAGFVNFRGQYNAGTAYVRNDGVYQNGSSWVALQATTGNAPPNLPATANAFWQLIAVKGQDGTGIGDMLTSVYDPQNKQIDAFSRANHTGSLPDAAVSATLTPDKAFRRGNILGTVAQVAGVPTGSVIEQGGTPSSGYIRFASGLQFCWRVNDEIPNSNNALGSIFGGSSYSLGAFPAAFSSLPAVIVAGTGSTGGGWIAQDIYHTVASWGSFSSRHHSNNGTTVRFFCIAIGRWF